MAEQYLSAFVVDAASVPDGSGRPADLGDPVDEATLPGRHWHELTAAFRAWGLTALADLWSTPWHATGDPWPFPMYATPAQVARIATELSAFDLDRIHDSHHLLPGGDDDAVEEVEWLLDEKFPAWFTAARSAGSGLYLLRDGAK
ncbi:hypothetical protein J2S43_002848 [Catenuloplanes nepalensis]|uniref:Uncharacterized protein n=1 Tax=Catenuloplanes nepalensis TaxID=587533 RepID=A0ABT9MSC7_9ACTN|nr:hypothetical protein [Catenuloplanes nepalensis]MDP9794336.1 hypothetical protein [Catenuloplanes nepalensis]